MFRRLFASSEMEVIAVNDLTSPEVLAHLLKYDSIHGQLSVEVRSETNNIIVGSKCVKVFSEEDPSQLPWRDYEIDLVVEASGRFTEKTAASSHLRAGAGQVLISAPARGDVPTVVLGVNENILDKGDTEIVSNASCTTNCLAPMVKVLDDTFGVEKGYITTVHAYTADQRLQDAPHKDLRRARAAALSIVPTSTGAAKAVGLVLPHLAGKLDGIAVRVPVPSGSLTDLSVVLKRATDKSSINQAMQLSAAGPMKGILQYTEEPLVSSDIIGNPNSCVFDAQLTAVNGNLAKVIGWYDNELGYAQRVVDLASKLLARR